MRIPFSVFVLAACHGKNGGKGGSESAATCDLDLPEWSEDGVVSPSPDVRITNSPWIPVMVHFPTLDLLGGSSESWLDCQSFPGAAPGVVRPRSDAGGGGVDFLTTLDTIDLEPGTHTLVHHFTSALIDEWVGSTFEYDPPDALVTAHVADSDGEPVYARIVVLRDNLPYDLASPDGNKFDPKDRDNTLTSIFAVNGTARVRLEPGEYRFVAARGPLDTVESQPLDVEEGDNELNFTIDRSVKPEGWWSAGDFHVHTGASFDAFLPDEARIYSLVAAGLDVIVPADHDIVRDFDWTIETILGKERSLFAIPGTEATIFVANPESDGKGLDAYKSYGHTSVFPLDPATTIVDPVVETTLADHLSRFRVAMTDSPYEGVTSGVLQLNHPRGIQERPDILLEPIHDLFNKMGFDPAEAPGVGKTNAWMAEVSKDGVTTAFDYDALEIMNRGSWEAYNQVRLDWLGLMSWGRRITGTGNSDSHAMAIEQAGFPTNMVPCRPPELSGAVDVECWTDAVREGRLVVTTGPFLALSLTHEKETYGLGEQFTRKGKGTVTANVRVRAAPWVPVPEVRLVVNGLIVHVEQVDPRSRDLDEPFEESYFFPVPAQPFDTYVLAEAGWSLDLPYPVGDEQSLGDYAVVAPGYLPMAFTNPIWIDEDGDGQWTGTGIPAPPKKK